jgi:signal transduction histidine kinase
MGRIPRNRKRRLVPLRMLLALLVGTVVVPSLLTLSVGIVALALWREATGLVVGVLTLSFAASAIAGGVTAVVFARRTSRLAEMQADFVANASHQLRTPLAGLRLIAETFEAGRGDDPTRRAALVEMLGDEVRRLEALVARILAWRRLDEGVVLAREPLAMTDVVEEAVKTIRRLPEGREAMIATTLPPHLPPVVGDHAVLVEAVANLVHNAVKFAGENGPIAVTVAPADGHVAVRVSDRGPGLDKDAQAHVFERFYRAPEHRSHRAGTGLGLAIAKAAAEVHGGTVTVESAPGAGTTFELRLPVEGRGGH